MTAITRLFRGRSDGRDEFIAVLRPHIDLMYRMAYRWTQCRHDAEDLVQDVLVRLTARRNELRHVEQLRPWLIKVLYRRYVDLYRRQQCSPLVPESELEQQAFDNPIPVLTERIDIPQRIDLQQTLLAALATLDDEQRDTLLLHDVEGYTALEVAEILEINVGTVKSRVHRARNHLKKLLASGTFSDPASCQVATIGK